MGRDGWEVFSKTFAVCLAAFLATSLIDRHFLSAIRDTGIRWATAFAIVQAIAAGLLAVSVLADRAFKKMKREVYGEIEPAIRDRILSLAFEGESWSSVVPSRGAARRAIEDAIAAALRTLKAPGRDRVARFAVENGFVAEWVKAFSSRSKADRKWAVSRLGLVSSVAGHTFLSTALQDEQAAVRVEACRALLGGGNESDIDAVFESVLRECLLVRALLADDLKRYAPYLVNNTIPGVLERASTLIAARCFEMLSAWKRALPRFDIEYWLTTPPDPLLWRALLNLLPYAQVDRAVDDYLLAGLTSTDAGVRCAAANAAGVLRVEGLIPQLVEALAAENVEVSLAAAKALAQIGEPGVRLLERVAVGSDEEVGALAMEALEHATVQVY